MKKQEKVYWVLGDSGEIDTIRFIFERRAKGIAYVVIAKMLNDLGTACARRGKWRNKDQKWSSGTIRSILENPAYYGARAYNRNSSSKIVAR
ncbi:MAG: recombinase family protein [Bacteroidota bacterium]